MEDRWILSAEEKTEDLEQDIAQIEQEFREGFQAGDRIDRAAVTIFGSARVQEDAVVTAMRGRRDGVSPSSAGQS